MALGAFLSASWSATCLYEVQDLKRASSDGGGGGDSAPEAVAPSGCETLPMHDFCDDFDRAALGQRWSDKSEPNGTLALVDGGLSPPGALLAVGNPGVAGQRATLGLNRANETGETIRCELDFRVDGWDANSSAQIFRIGVTSRELAFYELVLAMRKDAPYFQESTQARGAAPVFTPFSIPSVPFGQWVHARIDATLSGSKTVALSFNGISAFTGSIQAPKPMGYTLAIGLAYTEESTDAWTLRFDNVWCDWE